MSFNEKQIKKIAALARLSVTDDEAHGFAKQLEQILKYIEKLNEADCSSVTKPMTTPHEFLMTLREDVVLRDTDPATVVQCAPEQMYDNFKVPQVLGGSSTASVSKDANEGESE